METSYKHNLRVPRLKVFTDMSVNQMTTLELQDGSATLKLENGADGKVNNHEANHKSDMEVVFDLHNAKITFNGATGCTTMKMTQKLDADICIFKHAIIDARMETEAPFLKNSIAEAKFQAKVEDMKIDFTASHNAEFVGSVEGTVANSIVASLTPDEVIFDGKNKANAKVALPFRLSGKTDLQNDISFALNPMEQRASWTGLARFNQYKYIHLFSLENLEREINFLYQINGEANLDVLKERISIPEMTIPWTDYTMPRLEDFSLWEDAGFSYFFITTKQTLDINSNLKYMKNPDMIVIDINMEPVINAINSNAKALHKKMLIGKDKAAAIISQTYDKARDEYKKYSVELPKTITIPAYRIPLMDFEMSTYTIPLPDTTLIKMPSFHVPSALSKLTIPKVTLPKINSIKIPRLGDLTYEFSMKTAMLTLKTDASMLSQDGIVMKLDASSISEFDLLTGKVEGIASMKTSDGFKMDSILAVKLAMAEFNHDSTMLLTTMVDASMTNSAKFSFPYDATYEIYQTMNMNPNEGLVVSMSTPSAGLIGAQIQPKSLDAMKARIYGRYPSIPIDDVDIIDVKLSVVKSINIQTNWNTEMPYNAMLTVKDAMPDLETVSEPAINLYNNFYKEGARFCRNAKRSLQMATIKGKEMFKNAVDTVASVNPNEYMTAFSNNAIVMLREYRSKVEMVFDAIINFLKQTKFQIPNYEEKVTGLELYKIVANFFSDLSEEAIQRIPNYFTTIFTPIIEYFKSLEFQFSNHIVTGSEILEDFTLAFTRLQEQVIIIVKKIGSYRLEDILRNVSALTQFAMRQGEKFLQVLQSINFDKMTEFMSEVYKDAGNSKILKDAVMQFEKIYLIVMEYFRTVKARVQNMVDDISMEQLNSDMQSWMDRMIKNINTFQNKFIETLKEETKSVEQYVKGGDRHVEIDIPFPFVN